MSQRCKDCKRFKFINGDHFCIYYKNADYIPVDKLYLTTRFNRCSCFERKETK